VKIVILGCGRVGSTIAGIMFREGHDVTIMDRDPDSFRRLPADFDGVKFVGNGLDEESLRKAGLEKTDVFVAVTNGDNRNIMSVQLAKIKFNVPKVITRIYDPNRAKAYSEMGIKTLCTTCVGAGILRDMAVGEEFKTINQYLDLGLESSKSEESI